MLSDLRAEIKPNAMMDLERISPLTAIQNSKDLKSALKNGWLKQGRHSIIKTKAIPKPPEKIIERIIEKNTKTIEKSELDEIKLAELIRNVVREEQQDKKDEDIEKIVHKAVTDGVGTLMSSIRDKINAVSPGIEDPPSIDPEKLAEISQKSVNKISGELESAPVRKQKKITFINKDIHDLADEI